VMASKRLPSEVGNHATVSRLNGQRAKMRVADKDDLGQIGQARVEEE
jgi:hypothetical protein